MVTWSTRTPAEALAAAVGPHALVGVARRPAVYAAGLEAALPEAGELADEPRPGAHAEAVRLPALPLAHVPAAVLEVVPAATRTEPLVSVPTGDSVVEHTGLRRLPSCRRRSPSSCAGTAGGSCAEDARAIQCAPATWAAARTTHAGAAARSSHTRPHQFHLDARHLEARHLEARVTQRAGPSLRELTTNTSTN